MIDLNIESTKKRQVIKMRGLAVCAVMTVKMENFIEQVSSLTSLYTLHPVSLLSLSFFIFQNFQHTVVYSMLNLFSFGMIINTLE